MTHKPNWHPMVTNFIQLAKLHGIDCTSTLWLRMPDHQHLYLCTTLKTQALGLMTSGRGIAEALTGQEIHVCQVY